ncbi:MAG: class I SAM-dependent methyltransferase [Rhodothermales bacterium]
MSNRTIGLSDELYAYITGHTLREADVLRRLREETASHPEAKMQIAPEQGQFMALLVQMIRAERTLEVGVFTGYSSTAVALALPEHGRVVACDVSEEYTSVARRYWKEAGVDHKIELNIAPAVETLDRLLRENRQETFDFAFIDADKEQYDAYYERCLALMRRGGVIALDNMLAGGRVADPTRDDPAAEAIRRMNDKLQADDRVSISLVPIADGLSLALKR